MIEGSADQIPEERFIEALEFAHQAIQPIIQAIKQLVAAAGKTKAKFDLSIAKPEARAIIERVAGPDRSPRPSSARRRPSGPPTSRS